MLTKFFHRLIKLFTKTVPQPVKTINSEKPERVQSYQNEIKKHNLSPDELQQSESLFYDLMFGKISTGESSNSLENQILGELRNALQDIESISKNIVQLPSIISQVDMELHNPDHETGEIAQLIEQDPVIAAQVLKLVNSPLYKPGEEDFTDLQQSISYLGEKVIYQLIITAAIQNIANTPKIYYKLFGDQIWKHSLQTANISTDLARLKNESQASAYLIGLIHDIGKIAIFRILVDQLRVSHPDLNVCSTLFRQALTDNSRILSYKIAESWKLPKTIISPLKNQLNRKNTHADQLSEILYQANLYSELFMLLENGLIEKDFANRLCLSRNLDPDFLQNLTFQ